MPLGKGKKKLKLQYPSLCRAFRESARIGPTARKTPTPYSTRPGDWIWNELWRRRCLDAPGGLLVTSAMLRLGVGSDIGRCSPWTALTLTALLVSMPTLAEDVSNHDRDPRCPIRAVCDGDLASTSSATPWPGPSWRHHRGGGPDAGTDLVSKYTPARACGKKTHNRIARYLHDFQVHAGRPPKVCAHAGCAAYGASRKTFSEQHPHPPTHASSLRGSGG